MAYQSKYTGAQIDAGIDKANKAVVVPDTAPGAPRIVAINSDGTQQNLTLGAGITIADGVISASGGGNASRGYTVRFYTSINVKTVFWADGRSDFFNKTYKYGDKLEGVTAIEFSKADGGYNFPDGIYFDADTKAVYSLDNQTFISFTSPAKNLFVILIGDGEFSASGN